MKESYKELTLPELVAKREEFSKQYFKLRFDKIIGHLENPLELRTLRRKIARLNTRIHQKTQQK
ncbi:MAG TPA: 50S ribosomal protein L29 [Spirochaetales bacterium]|nr:50S ribosomal protein L29 [Spirochaetales bacterium]HOV38327.1 50S ribosomal protein L29 [Spirochaetales bacterium]